MKVSDEYASEHLELHCSNLDWWMDNLVTVLSSHRKTAPAGAAGGQPGQTGLNLVERADGSVSDLAGNDKPRWQWAMSSSCIRPAEADTASEAGGRGGEQHQTCELVIRRSGGMGRDASYHDPRIAAAAISPP